MGLRQLLERYFNHLWYRSGWQFIPWLPLSWLYREVVQKRRKAFLETSLESPGVPVIVVGNITVGGTGKTPVVIYLATKLRDRGFKVGVISRGYGRNDEGTREVQPDSLPEEVGDEPLLIKQRTGCVVVVDPVRYRAYQELVDVHQVDVVISDDGLQHYQLPRSYEIVVVDGQRGFGNGLLLPAGPLREPVDRLVDVDAVLINGENPQLTDRIRTMIGGRFPAVFECSLQPKYFYPIDRPDEKVTLNGLQKSVYGVAGIGNPDRFFETLEGLGYLCDRRPFPDHHNFQDSELQHLQGKPILVTEKDAVKMRHLSLESVWALAVDLQPNPQAHGDLVDLIVSKVSDTV